MPYISSVLADSLDRSMHLRQRRLHAEAQLERVDHALQLRVALLALEQVRG